MAYTQFWIYFRPIPSAIFTLEQLMIEKKESRKSVRCEWKRFERICFIFPYIRMNQRLKSIRLFFLTCVFHSFIELHNNYVPVAGGRLNDFEYTSCQHILIVGCISQISFLWMGTKVILRYRCRRCGFGRRMTRENWKAVAAAFPSQGQRGANSFKRSFRGRWIVLPVLWIRSTSTESRWPPPYLTSRMQLSTWLELIKTSGLPRSMPPSMVCTRLLLLRPSFTLPGLIAAHSHSLPYPVHWSHVELLMYSLCSK